MHDTNINNTCSFILKNYKQCKNKCNKIYNNIPYCTRHYNKLSLEFQSNNNINTNNNLFNIAKINEILIKIPELSNYLHLEYINSGTFVDVYKININNNIYALKYQDLHNKKNVLYYEYLLLSNHINNHINIVNNHINIVNENVKNTKLKSYYFKNKEYVLILTEYLPTSYYYFIENNIINNLDSINIIKNIGIQLINAIKYIHENKYLYIDLKPDNIMFKNNILKLIDFNLCIKYLDSYSKYYPNNKLKTRQGNDIYSSRNINLGFRGVRIDDIESILYILLDLLFVDEFICIKQSKQLKLIIDKKKYIFTCKFKYSFINSFIEEINKYVSNDSINNELQNKQINYTNFLKILNF
jgi:serine/threonine protein kinase